MKWFRSDLVAKKYANDIYGQMVRLAVDKFRERDYAQAVYGFRNAAMLKPLDAHHEALMKRAVIRWKQSIGTDAPPDATA